MSPRRRASTIELPVEGPPGDTDGPAFGRLSLVRKDRDHVTLTARQQVAAFLAQSRKQFLTAENASSKFRREMREDQLFASGGGHQWDPTDRASREGQGRPCIEINRIPQFIRQVSNQNRANRSQIQINARGKGATTKVGNALQGLVRSIEVESDADVAYDTATDHQLRSGMGFVRLMAAWAPDDDFQQVCRIRRIRNPLAVYWDPSTQEADFADCRWMHIIGVMGKDEYEARWGKTSDYASLNEYMVGMRALPDWMPEGRVVIAEYYTLTVEERAKLRMDNGATIWKEELQKYREAFALGHPDEPVPGVARERLVETKVVRWCFHNAVEILEGNDDKTGGRELPGSRIPIFPLMGDELDLDGEVDYRGMTRDARDPQKMYNFWSSCIAEATALAPKAPWIAAKGQIEQYMDDWKRANREAKAVLVYDPKAVGDQLVPPPQRNAVEPAIQAMVLGLGEADRDLKSVMGLFEPSLGDRREGDSGKAILAMQQQGNVSNSNYLDNQQRMKRSIGRALLEWIPVTYDVARVVHLLHPDGKKQPAVVYSGAQNKPDADEFEGITDIFDLGVGHFDVTVSTGPSYQTQKQQTETWLLELFKVLPGLAEMGADIVLENSDDPAAQQLAKRVKKSLPAKYQDDTDPEMQLPILEHKVQEQGALLEQANKIIASMSHLLDTKQLDNDTKKEIALIQAQSQMAIAAMKVGDQVAARAAMEEMERLRLVVEQVAGETQMASQQDHEQTMAAQQAAAQMKQQDAAGQQAMTQTAMQQAAPPEGT